MGTIADSSQPACKTISDAEDLLPSLPRSEGPDLGGPLLMSVAAPLINDGTRCVNAFPFYLSIQHVDTDSENPRMSSKDIRDYGYEQLASLMQEEAAPSPDFM